MAREGLCASSSNEDSTSGPRWQRAVGGCGHESDQQDAASSSSSSSPVMFVDVSLSDDIETPYTSSNNTYRCIEQGVPVDNGNAASAAVEVVKTRPLNCDDESSRTSCTTRSTTSYCSSSDVDDDEHDEESSYRSANSNSLHDDEQLLLPLHQSSHDDSYDDSDCERRTMRRKPSRQQSGENRSNALRSQCGTLIIGTVGIYIAYISYGMIQEDLYRYKRVIETFDIDHDDDATAAATTTTTLVFSAVWFLQVLESAASILVGSMARYLFQSTTSARGSSQQQTTHTAQLSIRPFLLSGTTQVLAKVLMSLSLVAGASFPVATLAKSAKIVPVMIGQFLLGGSTYGHRDCTFAILVVVGTVLLSLGSSSSTSDETHDTWMGVLLIALSLVMDGCTGGLQKQLLRNLSSPSTSTTTEAKLSGSSSTLTSTTGSRPSTYDFVVYSHMAMILVALFVSLVTGDFAQGVSSLMQDGAILRMVTSLCALSVLGQFFIFYIIAHFDPLVCATITTTRKIWSVLLSISFHGHALSTMGYVGVTLAITGLLIEVQGKLRPATTLRGSKHASSSKSYGHKIKPSSHLSIEWEQQRLLSQPAVTNHS